MRVISSSSNAVISDTVNTTINLPKVELYYITGVNLLIIEQYYPVRPYLSRQARSIYIHLSLGNKSTLFDQSFINEQTCSTFMYLNQSETGFMYTARNNNTDLRLYL